MIPPPPPSSNLHRPISLPKMPSGGGTSVHITALDGIVNVNSLFTLAVFLGLTWNPTDPNNSLIDNPSCNPGPKVAEDLIAFHVYSFSSFLFSSLIAVGLKQGIRICRSPAYHPAGFLCRINRSVLRVGMLVSGVGSVCGCGFLMLALINVVQIKLGTLGCGSSHTYAAIVPLVIFVPAALLIYICIVLYAFFSR
ncbi:maternal effect embryo arrest [Parasponia andersonii]|uniref:Maternal effect embryo arrest n=1 Tax=Parasponia andersonii TaxID=3476 RepID=A0A2P5C6B3_PARAD|nr:maternal effect embryo arrest [Parasponia andersonii]